jgi:hypothetical protein
MSDARENDPYAVIEREASTIYERAREAVEKGEADRVSDAAVVDLMSAAVKLYAAKAGRDAFRPLRGDYDEELTGTEVLTAAIELLRALGLGPMELALWSHRKPKDYAYTAYTQERRTRT